MIEIELGNVFLTFNANNGETYHVTVSPEAVYADVIILDGTDRRVGSFAIPVDGLADLDGIQRSLEQLLVDAGEPANV